MRPVVSHQLPLAEAAQAHRVLEAQHPGGKIVLTVAEKHHHLRMVVITTTPYGSHCHNHDVTAGRPCRRSVTREAAAPQDQGR
ncbi:MAG: zinc-binding dehydrogenase [Leifsonia sp.]